MGKNTRLCGAILLFTAAITATSFPNDDSFVFYDGKPNDKSAAKVSSTFTLFAQIHVISAHRYRPTRSS